MRENQRNGYRERSNACVRRDTRAGRITLAIPKLRKGSCFPSLLEPRRTAEKALVAVIEEACVHGVSTRSVDERSGPCIARNSSRCCFVRASPDRLASVSRAVIVAVGVNKDGKREVLGVHAGHSQAETFWTEFLRSLADRDLRGVKLVIADDHKGLRAAARRVFRRDALLPWSWTATAPAAAA